MAPPTQYANLGTGNLYEAEEKMVKAPRMTRGGKALDGSPNTSASAPLSARPVTAPAKAAAVPKKKPSAQALFNMQAEEIASRRDKMVAAANASKKAAKAAPKPKSPVVARAPSKRAASPSSPKATKIAKVDKKDENIEAVVPAAKKKDAVVAKAIKSPAKAPAKAPKVNNEKEKTEVPAAKKKEAVVAVKKNVKKAAAKAPWRPAKTAAAPVLSTEDRIAAALAKGARPPPVFPTFKLPKEWSGTYDCGDLGYKELDVATNYHMERLEAKKNTFPSRLEAYFKRHGV